MSTVIQALKNEIQRLAKKQIKAFAAPIKKDVARLKRIAAALKRNLAQLQKQSAVLLDAEARRSRMGPAMSEDELAKLQLRGAAVRKMRKKMKLTQQEFAKLAGTSPVSVGKWEKAGRKQIQLRGESKKSLAKLIGVGAQEAKLLLERLAEQKPVAKKPAPKTVKVKKAEPKKAKKAKKPAKSGKSKTKAAKKK